MGFDKGFSKDDILKSLLSGLDDIEKASKKRYEDLGEDLGRAIGQGLEAGIEDSKTQLKHSLAEIYLEFLNFKRSIERRATKMKPIEIQAGLKLAVDLSDTKYKKQVEEALSGISIKVDDKQIKGLPNVIKLAKKDMSSIRDVDWGFGKVHDKGISAKQTQESSKVKTLLINEETKARIQNTEAANIEMNAVKKNAKAKEEAYQVLLHRARSKDGDVIPLTYTTSNGKYRVEKGTTGWNLSELDDRGFYQYITSYEKLEDVRRELAHEDNQTPVIERETEARRENAEAAEREAIAIKDVSLAKKESKSLSTITYDKILNWHSVAKGGANLLDLNQSEYLSLSEAYLSNDNFIEQLSQYRLKLVDELNDIKQRFSGEDEFGEMTSFLENEINQVDEIVNFIDKFKQYGFGAVKSFEELKTLCLEYEKLYLSIDFNTLEAVDNLDGSKKTNIKKDFLKIYSARRREIDALKNNTDFIDENGNGVAPSEEHIEKLSKELEILGAAYINAGGSLDDFSKKQQEFVSRGTEAYSVAKELNDAFGYVDNRLRGNLTFDDYSNIGDALRAGDIEKIANILGVEIPLSEQKAKKSLLDFLNLWNEVSKKYAPEDMGNRYGYLMEGVTGETPSIDVDLAYDELILKDKEYQLQIELEREKREAAALEMKSFINQIKDFDNEIKSSLTFVEKYADLMNLISEGSLTAALAVEVLKEATQNVAVQPKQEKEGFFDNSDISSSVLNNSELDSLLKGFNIKEKDSIDSVKLDFIELILLMSNNSDAETVLLKFQLIINKIKQMGSVIEETDLSYVELYKDFKNLQISVGSERGDFSDEEWKYYRRHNPGMLVPFESGKGQTIEDIDLERYGIRPESDNNAVLLRAFLDAFMKGRDLAKGRKTQKENLPSTEDFNKYLNDSVEGIVTLIFWEMIDKGSIATSASESIDELILPSKNLDKQEQEFEEIGDAAEEATKDVRTLSDEIDKIEEKHPKSGWDITTIDDNGKETNSRTRPTLSGALRTVRQSTSMSEDGTLITTGSLTDNYSGLVNIFNAQNKNLRQFEAIVRTSEQDGTAINLEITDKIALYKELTTKLLSIIDQLETNTDSNVAEKLLLDFDDASAKAKLLNEEIKVLTDPLKNGAAAAQKQIKSREDGLKEVKAKIGNINQEDIGPIIEDKVKQLESTIAQMKNVEVELGKTTDQETREGLAKSFEESNEKAKLLKKEIDDLIKSKSAFWNLESGSIISTTSVEDGTAVGSPQMKQQIEEFALTISNNRIEIQKWNSDNTAAFGTIDRGKGVIEKIAIAYDLSSGKIIAYRKETLNLGNAFSKMLGYIKGGAIQAIRSVFGGSIVMEGVQQFRKGIQYIREIDVAMTELKKVTDETEETYSRFLSTASKTAGTIGSTVLDVTKVTSDFARLGYAIDDAAEMAKTALVYKNVGDGFLSVDEASESIISTMKAYGVEANNTMSIVDKFNAVGNNFAITSKGIGDALQRSASALYESGNTIDESIALVTGANSVVQNPELVGTALKTLTMRLRGAKVELEDAGLDADNMATSVSTLRTKLLALTKQKVDIMADDSTFKNTTEILREMSSVWDEMSDVDRASALELMGGKRQANILASLIKNWQTVESVIETSQDSAGSAMRENAKYMQSILGHIDLLVNSVQTMWMKFMSTDVVKWCVDFIKLLTDIAGKIGLIPSLLTGLGVKFVLIPQIAKAFANVKSSVAQSAAEIASETITTDANTASKLKNAIQSSGASTAVQEEAIKRTLSVDALGEETVALEANTKAKLANALANSGMDESTIGNIINNVMGGNNHDVSGVGRVADVVDDVDLDDTGSMWANWINGAEDVSDVADNVVEVTDEIGDAAESTGGKLTGLSGVFKKLAGGIKAFASTTLGAISIFAVFTAAAVAIIDLVTVSFEEAKETLNGTTDELNDTQSNIKSLNGELENTNQRIAELLSKGKLSFVEDEELKKLEDQNRELLRSIDLEEQREKRLLEKQAKDAQAVYDRDLRFLEVTATYHGETDTISNGYVDTIARVKKDQDNYNDAKKKYEDLMNSDASAKDIEAAEKEMEKTKEICETSKDYLSQTISDLDETYGDLTWQYGDNLEDWQKQINAILKSVYDAQDKSEIALANANGSASEIANAYNNAFKRVSRQTEFEDELKLIQEDADITSDKLREMLSFDNGLVDASAGGMSEFIQSLIDCGFISDATEESLQKVIDASIMLGDCTSDAAIANKKLAKSQKELQYYKQYKELHDYIKKIKDSDRSLEDLTDEERNNINAMTDKLKLLSEEISRYDILGDLINEAKEAFDNFENAKQSDSNSDLLDSTSEMFKSIIDGFQSAELGSDTFRAALQGLVPESVYEDLDTLEEKYDAIWNYVNEDLKSYFTVEYDDDGVISGVETTSQNVENFIQDAKDKGLLSFTDGVWKVNETDFGNFAKDMNITESLLVAIGTQMDKMDADWINGDLTSFFDSFDMGTEAEIYQTVQALASLDELLINGKIDSEEYAKQYTELQEKLKTSSEEALNNVLKYNDATKVVDDATAKVEKAKNKLQELKDTGASESEIKLATNNLTAVTEKLGDAICEKGKLTAPSELEISVAQDELESQISLIKSELSSKDWFVEPQIGEDGIKSDLIELSESGDYQVKIGAKIPEEDKSIIDEYVNLLNLQKTLDVYINGTEDAQLKVDDLNKSYKELCDLIDNIPSPDIDTSDAVQSVNRLKEAIDNINSKTVYITAVKNTVGDNFVSGTAHASGSWGLKNSEKEALVGELGTEMVVDPSSGKYYTVGDSGAEFVDLPKNAIIFNHKLTEEILKNGHINSRGKAYASGNAYDGGTSGTIFNKHANTKSYGKNSSSNNSNSSNSTDSLSDSAETIKDAADEFKEVFDWFEVLLKEVDSDLNLMAAKLENAVSLDAKDKIYKQILSTNRYKKDELSKGAKLYQNKADSYFKQIPKQYQEMAKNGAVKITDFVGEGNEKVVEAIKNYREWAEKVSDLNQQLEETKKIIADTRVDKQQEVRTSYDNKNSLRSAKNDRIQESIDLLEAQGKSPSASMYTAMINNDKTNLSNLKSAKTKMQAELDAAVKSGDVKKYSSQWYEMVGAINDVDAEISSCNLEIEGFLNSINDLHWDKFDKLITKINNISEEAENVRSLIDEDDAFSETGDWTKEGITSIGLLITEMENAQYLSLLYGKEITQLGKDFKKGKYSQDEYNEKLKELQDKQWDATKSYESSKKELISLNKARVQAVKDGMQKEIDAYEKLINKQKESLDAQKDAHDWNKQVAEQQKEIDKIQRQIDAMAGDNSAAAVAKRAQLYEELYELQDELAESFYLHDIEMQQKALDDSLDAFKTDKEDKMEALDEYLKNEEKVTSDSFDLVQANTKSVSSTLKGLLNDYGIKLSDALVNPWKEGANAIGEYTDGLDASSSAYTACLKDFKSASDEIKRQTDEAGQSILDDINKNSSDITKATYVAPEPKKEETKKDENKKQTKTKPSKGDTVTVDTSATRWSRDGGNGTKMDSWVPGSSFTVYLIDGDEALLGRNGAYTGWINIKDLKGYAKGTIGVKKNQFARIDEQLEELVLHADGSGKLAYLTKGTGVIPGDLTKNLMQWGKLNPQSFLDLNRPKIDAPHVTSNNVELNFEFGSLVHVDSCSNDTIPELQKIIKTEFDSMMKQVNKGLKKYTR